MPLIVNKLFKYFRNFIFLGTSDCLLVSFPKSGNTWIRFYLCNLINTLPQFRFTDKSIDFGILDKTMIELGKDNLAEKWKFKGFPRIIKTHLSYNFLFGNHKSILVVRDPRDVMVSYFKFETTKNFTYFKETGFSEFIRHPRFGIRRWCTHYLSWKNQAGLIIKYEDLKTNDYQVFVSINKYLDIAPDDNYILKAMELSKFENIKQIEEIKGLANPSIVKDSFKFTRSGKTGQWKIFFSDEDLKFVNNIMKEHSIDIYDYTSDGYDVN